MTCATGARGTREPGSRTPLADWPAPRRRTLLAGLPARRASGGLSWGGLLILACGLLFSCAVWANSQVVVRVTAGDHPDYGRVVLDAPGLAYTVERDNDHLLVRFPDQPTLGALPPAPRNVLALREVSGGVDLTMVAGASVHATRMGTKVVIDVGNSAPGGPLAAPSPNAHDAAVQATMPMIPPSITERPVPPRPLLANVTQPVAARLVVKINAAAIPLSKPAGAAQTREPARSADGASEAAPPGRAPAGQDSAVLSGPGRANIRSPAPVPLSPAPPITAVPAPSLPLHPFGTSLRNIPSGTIPSGTIPPGTASSGTRRFIAFPEPGTIWSAQ